MSEPTGNTAKQPATKKAAVKPPAEKVAQTPDEVLLAQQAEEEADGRVLDAVANAQALEASAAERQRQLDEREAAVRARELEHEERLAAALAVADDEDLHLSDDGLTPGIRALLEAQRESTASIIESLAEKLAGRTGGEVQITQGQVALRDTGQSADQLLEQLDGTVSDGGDGENPLDFPVTFIARGVNYRVVRKPRRRGVGPTGEQFFTTGVAADFAPSGQFTTRNSEIVSWLKGRPGFGTDFWVQGAEPFSAPDPKVIMGQIFAAMMALDDAALEKLQDEEQASHKRKVVLDALEQARAQVQGFDGADRD